MKKHLAILLGLVAGCGKPAPPPPAPPPPAKAAASPFEENLGELVGTLRFLNHEYAAAVKEGKIIDQTEYDESTMAAGQAARLWKKVEEELAKKDAAEAKALGEKVAALKELVKSKVEPPAVSDATAALTKALQVHLGGSLPPNVRATAASVQAADADIKGEVVVEEYRIGVATFAPRSFYFGAEEKRPAAGDTHFLAIVIREKGTKRALPTSRVTATIGGKAVALTEIWSEYLFYGANVALPEGSSPLVVDIEPPRICRHGDALSLYAAPARAEVTVRRKGMEVTVEAPKPGPVIADYSIGQDVEQAIAESIFLRDEGDYRIGFIAEGPEPIWVWSGDKLESRPAKDEDTHHLEIALLERGTNRIVTGATVRLTLKDKATGRTETVEMHNLLSAFAHYGQTLKVAPAAYEVTATIEPPKVGTFEKGKFVNTATIVFEWDGKPKQE